MIRSPLALPVLATALLALPVHGQIEPGRTYTGGETISDPASGLALTLPSGWRGALAGGGEAFMMEAESGDGVMFVVADAIDEAAARAQMTAPMDLGLGFSMALDGEIRRIATGHLTAAYTVTGAPNPMVGTVDVRLTNSGLGVAFVLLAAPESAEEHRASMREFALSLGVTEPTAQNTGGNDEWQPYLMGRYLARFFTRTGYTESTELWLCSDGTFYFNDQAGGFGGGASGAVQGVGNGRWSATGAGAEGTLILQWSGGGESRWALEYDYAEDRLYVNGERMLRGENERCS